MTIGTDKLLHLHRAVRNRHLLPVDLALLPMAAVMSFALRLNSLQLQDSLSVMLVYALASPLIQVPILALLGVYSRFWQYASTDELMLLAWAALIGGVTQGALFLGVQAIVPDLLIPGVPRSVPLIAILVTFICIAAPRFALRVWTQRARRNAKAGYTPEMLQHVLIAGAGEAGVMVLRELQANPQAGLVPVGFVDDDRDKRGMLIHRVRVLGGRDAIPELVREHHVEQVIIAMPSAGGKTVREIVEVCEQAGARARIIPGVYELLAGYVSLQQIRDVQIEDLLRRAPVQTDTAAVATLVSGRRVLVTGAGGSIGAELCRQITRLEPSELVLLGHGENSIFNIYTELNGPPAKVARPGLLRPGANSKRQLSDRAHFAPVIADVRDADRLRAIFEEHRPEIVFHAAAHKHVPLMESNLVDAVTNNVLGTRCLVEASIRAGVDHFILISTDKAVNPSSVMGATKRVAELIVQEAARRTGRCYAAVRFGNVLGSRGSVVPSFQRQIATGGPVTVTHPEMRRYFMTIPEAVQLVLQAAALGCGGEIFVLDMGEPVRILDLAQDLIRLSGLEPGRDIEITFTGLRPGEKLTEQLFGPDEVHTRTAHDKIFVCSDETPRADSGLSVGAGATPVNLAVDALAQAVVRGEEGEVRRLLEALAPAYPSQRERVI